MVSINRAGRQGEPKPQGPAAFRREKISEELLLNFRSHSLAVIGNTNRVELITFQRRFNPNPALRFFAIRRLNRVFDQMENSPLKGFCVRLDFGKILRNRKLENDFSIRGFVLELGRQHFKNCPERNTLHFEGILQGEPKHVR